MWLRRTGMLLVAVLMTAGAPPGPGRVMIEGGSFTPLYGVRSGEERLTVQSFLLDRVPVTNRAFAAFAGSQPVWATREGLSPLVSDGQHLKHWVPAESGRLEPRAADLDKPVVFVSWFAATDFCVARGGRLPTVLEWEYAGAANERVLDASHDARFIERLLAWYSRPSGGVEGLPRVGQGTPDIRGVHDMHGVVWEWTADFNSVFVAADNRREGERLTDAFCGAGAAAGMDRANYAAFMRYALRNSLKGHYTTGNLGFRCAYDPAGGAGREVTIQRRDDP